MRQNLKDLLSAVAGQHFRGGRVVEIGAYQVPGQEGFADLRPFFPGADYVGCDMRKGPGVDMIEDVHRLSFPNGSADWVICFDTLEHVYDPLLAMKELLRILAPDGIILISSVMNFQIHDYPGDYWRFTPEIFWHMLSSRLPFRRVMFQGDDLNPHTVIGIGAGREGFELNLPATLDNEPLEVAPEPSDRFVPDDIAASPYRPVIDFHNDNNVHTWILKQLRPGSRVLELGCADGFFSRLLRDSFNCAVTGVEIDKRAAHAAEKVCEQVINADLDTPSMLLDALGDSRFDYVVAVEVLEHLKDPGAVLEQAAGLLAPEGRIFFSVPNVAHASLALELLDGKWDTSSSGLLDRTHLRFFTLKTLLNMLQEHGLAALAIHRIVIDPRATEFGTMYDSYPREVTAYLEKVNPEYNTYQFVIEAAPGSGGLYAWDSPLEGLLAERARLEKLASGLEDENMRLRQEINAMKKGISWRVTRPLRQLKHMLLGRGGRVE
jgi:2-polyprenyl-3-methyl-5-hydroxy-6-metoxy-1,4-benzoquinol methylase